MSKPIVSRRSFVQATGAMALTAASAAQVLGANDEVVLGIIGTGGRGTRDLQGLTNIKGVRMAAICDLRNDRLDRAEEVCEQYRPKVRRYTDFRQMLDKEKLDGCLVATEVGNHAHCVIPVLEAGLNCFSEKPMDCTVEKVDQIVKAARKAKGFYQVGFQRRYSPAFQNAIKAIHDGVTGPVRVMQGQWHWDWAVGGWVLDVDMSGGELVEQACHHMDVMNWVMKGQHPIQCMAMGRTTTDHQERLEHYSEDYSCVLFEFPGGVTFSYTHVFYGVEEFNGEKLWVWCRDGGVNLPQSRFFPRDKDKKPVQFYDVPEDWLTNWDNGTMDELEAFPRQIRNGEKALSNEETGRVSTLMSLMGRASMYKRDTKKYDSTVVKWEDLGSTT